MVNSNPYPVVVFDGACGFCRSTLKFLRDKYDFAGVSFLPYSDEIAELWEFPTEIIDQHKTYMYFFASSTEFHKGYFAFQHLFNLNNDTKKISNIMRFRVVKYFGKTVYILVSKNRKRLSGPNASCGL